MKPTSLRQAFVDHSRQWEHFSLVYPVISRRSRGLSIGINLNPDAVCNFNCTYCCVDRHHLDQQKDAQGKIARPAVSLDVLVRELDAMLEQVKSGAIWEHARFCEIPTAYRRVNDIAFSGDGEPTTSPLFAAAVDMVIALKHRHGLGDVKIVLITNATMLHRPDVEAALQRLDAPAARGEVWAKLDAGSEHDYKRIDRSNVPYQRVVDNIARCGQQRDLVIQTMLLAENGTPPDDTFIDAYLSRIEKLLQRGCRIKAIQLYTIARQTAEMHVSALDATQLQATAQRIRERFEGVAVNVYA